MKQLLVLLMLLCSSTLYAQDVIVKKDGSTIVCRVVEVNSSEVIYKKWSDLNGSNYVMDRSMVSTINYENGRKETFSQSNNYFKPGNQNDGYRQINDNALIGLDNQAQKPLKKAKTLKSVGIIGGTILLGVGGFLLYDFIQVGSDEPVEIIASITCFAGGITLGYACLRAANNIKQRYNIQNTSLLRKDIKLKNSTTISPSLDLLRDQAHNTQTLGIGLRYNF